jgi:hypothetical protein
MASRVFGTRKSNLGSDDVFPIRCLGLKDKHPGLQCPRRVTRERPQEALPRGPSRACLSPAPKRASHLRSRKITRRKALRQRELQNFFSGDWGGGVKRR